MEIKFTKMQAQGNDFIVIDTLTQNFLPNSDVVKFLCDRHIGVGADQLLLISPIKEITADFNYQIFNADGQEVKQCGNGARCVGVYLNIKKFLDKKIINLHTANGKIQLQILSNGIVKANLGAPKFEPAALPLLSTASFHKVQDGYSIKINDELIEFYAVSMGNPHIVIFVKNLMSIDVASFGKKIAMQKIFPESCNVNFMQIDKPEQEIKLRTYERGVGETLACGSGAAASVVIAKVLNLIHTPQVTVSMPGGKICVSYDVNNGDVWLSGEATLVYEGIINI